MLYALLAIAVALTWMMFSSKERMLGFPCAMFWALLGGQAYTLSETTWDIYYLLFFASAFGMTIFTALAAFALREKRDTYADEELEKGEGEYIDEGKEETGEEGSGEHNPKEPRMRNRTKGIRERAEDRRTRRSRRTRL